MSGMFRLMALMTAALFAPAACRADGFDSLQEALIRIIRPANLANLARFDYDGSGCLFGYLLDPGALKGMTRSFQAGRDYVILGAGDNDISDLDMWITPEGRDQVRLVQDTQPDAEPGFRFRPSWSGNFTIHINNVQSQGPSFCCFIVLVGVAQPQFALLQLAEALDNSINLARLRGLFAKGFPRNGLVLFGGKFGNNDASASFDLTLPAGKYVAISTGSNNVQDVDLFVRQQFRRGASSGSPIAQDIGNDNTPLCDFTAFDGPYYSITTKNARSQMPGFVFAVVLRD